MPAKVLGFFLVSVAIAVAAAGPIRAEVDSKGSTGSRAAEPLATATAAATATAVPYEVTSVTRDAIAGSQADPEFDLLLDDVPDPRNAGVAHELSEFGNDVTTPPGVSIVVKAGSGATMTLGPDSRALFFRPDEVPDYVVVVERGSLAIDDPRGRQSVSGRDVLIAPAAASYVVTVNAAGVTIGCTKGRIRTRHVLLSPDTLATVGMPILETIGDENFLAPSQSTTYEFRSDTDLRADYKRLAAAGSEHADAAQVDLAMLNFAPDGLPHVAPSAVAEAAIAALHDPVARNDDVAAVDLDAIAVLESSTPSQAAATDPGDLAGEYDDSIGGGSSLPDRVAAAGHVAAAELHLAIYHQTKMFHIRHPELAVPWLLRAVADGSENAKRDLADAYDHADGTAANPRAATVLWRELAAAGDERAEDEMGDRYFRGFGVAADARQSLAFYEAAAAQHDEDAEASAALQYERGIGTGVDYRMARKYYGQLAARNRGIGFAGLGYLYLNGKGVARDDAEAFALLQAASKHGDARGTYLLGTMYASGRGTRRDPARAIALFRQAATSESYEAAAAIPRLEEHGVAVPVDLVAAFTWTLIANAMERDVELTPDGRALERRLTPAQRREARRGAVIFLNGYHAPIDMNVPGAPARIPTPAPNCDPDEACPVG